MKHAPIKVTNKLDLDFINNSDLTRSPHCCLFQQIINLLTLHIRFLQFPEEPNYCFTSFYVCLATSGNLNRRAEPLTLADLF